MSNDFIRRSDAMNKINDIAADFLKEHSIQCDIAAGVAVDIKNDVIKTLPAADVVEVVHSKWIKRNNERRCPVCGFFYLTNGMTVYNLCPMCGAKMDGKDINVTTKTNLPDDVRQNILNTFMKGSED